MKIVLFLSLSIISLGFGLGVAAFAESSPSVTELRSNTAADTAVRHRLNASKSNFMVFANRTGLAYFKGKSHQIAVRDFDGEASLDPTALNPASLEMTIK